MKEHVHQENLISIFDRSISIRSPPKLNLYLRGNQTINMDDLYLGMLQEDLFATYNYYGSQVYVNVTSPGTSSTHFVHPYVHPSQPSTSQSSQDEDSRENEDETRKRGKGTKKQAAKYNSFEPEEERYLVNLWVSYHERLESKDARKYWSQIVDELNAEYNHSRNVEKCKRKMKYLHWKNSLISKFDQTWISIGFLNIQVWFKVG